MNKIQYIALTHTSKDEAKDHKRKANYSDYLYYGELTYEEILDIHDNGCIFGRIGNKTDFLVIDIDTTTVDIMKAKNVLESEKYHVEYSCSNNNLKYHIFVKLDKEITNSEYADELKKEFEIVKNMVATNSDVFILDNNAANFYQCFFGPSVNNSYRWIENENDHPLVTWTKKDEEPQFKVEKHWNIPSLNAADWCRKNNQGYILEMKRYDIITPMMRRGKLIKIGHRWNWSKLIGTQLLMRMMYLIKVLDEEWTREDYLNTFDMLVRQNTAGEFHKDPDYKALRLWMESQWNIALLQSFEDNQKIYDSYFNCSKKPYVSREFKREAMHKMVLDHMVSNPEFQKDYIEVVYRSKAELYEDLENSFISEKTFKNFLDGMNAKLKIIHRGNYDSSDFAWMISLNEHAIAKKLYEEGIREIDNTWRSRFCRFKKSTKMIKDSLKNLINPPTVSENFEF